MVSFSCENCGDILTKKKLDPHRNRCRGASFTCIDCMTHFWGTEYRSHTTCMTEAQKYEGSLYKPKPEKNQRRNNNNNNSNNNNNQGTNNSKQASKPSNGHRAPYVEDAPDADNPAGNAALPPPAPSPPPTDTKKPTHATPRQKGADPVNVFDFLVTSETPNASKVSVGGSKEQMKMVDHAPSVFETSQALAELGADADDDDDDDDKKYDVAYEENGFSYGSGPIPPSVYANKAAPTVSMEFMTPAPKKKKDRSSRTADAAATTSDKKRKRRTDDHGRDGLDTPMGEAPSSVVNHPGTPMLNHSGLTGGLNRMLRSPSLDGEAGDGPADHPRRRYQDPSSPIKRTRRDDKETAGGDPGLGISMKNRAGRLVSSMFGGSVASTSSNGTDPTARSAARSSRRRGSSDDDGQSAPVDTRSSKKTSRVRGAPLAAAAVSAPDSRKSKRKSSAPIDSDRPSRRLREIEYAESAPRGEDGHQMVVYGQPNHPDALQQEMASHFLSLVTKGPGSGRGFSMNKVLKRFHRDVTDEFDADRGRETGRSRADRERRMDDEKELWRTLRVKQNERGEIVLFF